MKPKTTTKKKTETFREWRKRLGLRLEDIALKTHINYSTIARWDEDPSRRPIEIIRRTLAAHYSDCPLAVIGK